MKYERYSVHRSERVAKFWANKSNGTYLGYKDGVGYTYAIEKSGTTKFGHDKGGYIVGYNDKYKFEVRETWKP
tara:strand:+ start:277 stop:495 length:219 start_codon:yes stop_codon:yes gene_type:complete